MGISIIFTAPQNFEDSQYPLLGPNLKGLFTFGLLQQIYWEGNKYRIFFLNLIHVSSMIFVITQLVDLYFTRNDFDKALLNMSITVLSFVSICKTISCLVLQSRLVSLIKAISKEEIAAIKEQQNFVMKLMKNYTKYVRFITNLYWTVVLITNIVTILSPLLKYLSTSSYREDIKNDTEPYPQILSSWFPFNNLKMPGYIFATAIHVIMITQGAGVIAVYDANAFAIMTYLKGQFIILREKCRRIFGGDEVILTKIEVQARIKECHRHHNFLLKQCSAFDKIISPVMFIYVLVCSITICCSVVQLSLESVSTTQKLWVLEYSSALAIQLFLFCWHSNEMTVESDRTDRGVYESNWWKANLQERKQLVLLAGKLARPLVMNAGPFTALSVQTFVDIMTRTYSFYTLFTQMQEKDINANN
ncbi:unnamed protein product [Parnassius mnemosyne]|uniref:Odorant receptor n=1 Tax=Parnassius mnemosyne TaxID=213953 RepID=A0AAV1LES8_9NEOP